MSVAPALALRDGDHKRLSELVRLPSAASGSGEPGHGRAAGRGQCADSGDRRGRSGCRGRQ